MSQRGHRQPHGHVVVVGGGGTGAAIIHDLVSRGFTVTLIERGELTSGTTGRHHGQLHSGARYAVGDREIARECMEEVRILRRIAPQALEMNYGLFVALNEEDDAFAEEFIDSCNAATIPAKEIPLDSAFAMEPNLNRSIRRAVQVPDGTIDAWRLPLHFFATARAAGADIRTFTELIAVERTNGRVNGVRVRRLTDGRGILSSCGCGRQRHRRVGGKGGAIGGNRAPGDARSGDDGGGETAAEQHGGQPAPPSRRRGHHRSPAGIVNHRIHPMADR